MSQESKPVTIFWYDFLAIPMALFITLFYLPFIAQISVLQHSALHSCFWSLAYLSAVWPSLSSNSWPQDPVSTKYYRLVTEVRNYTDTLQKGLSGYLFGKPSYLENLCPALLLAKV